MVNYVSVIFVLWVMVVAGYKTALLISSNKLHMVRLYKLALAEYELRSCGELKAVNANFKNASEYLKKEFPGRAKEFDSEVLNAMNQLTLYYDNKDATGALERCQSHVLQHFDMDVHREENPDVPKVWPNEVARFYTKKE